MKLMSLFLFFMAINIGLFLISLAPDSLNMSDNSELYPGSTLTSFDAANPDFAGSAPITEENSVGKYKTGGYSAPDLYNAWLFPGGGNNSRIILYLIAFALLIGALGFIPFINRSDLSVLSGPFIILLGVGGVTCVNTWDFVNKHTASFMCEINKGCMMSNMIGAIIGGTLMIAWIFSCLEWWTGRPTGP